MEKTFISAQELLTGSFDLAEQILRSGFRPDYIVGVWRGGAPIGIAVQEALEFCGIASDHIAIRTSSYHGIGEQDAHVRVHGLHYLIENVNADDSLLIIDDVFDSGRSVAAIIREMQILSRLNMPKDLRVGTVYYKPTKNMTDRVPDFYCHETDKWLVFPHELDGLSEAEVRENKGLPEGLMQIRKEYLATKEQLAK